MPLAHEVATELRKFAARLDSDPEAEISRPYLSFSRDYTNNDKEKFLAVARFLLRPFAKKYDDRELMLTYDSPALYLYARIDRNLVCEIVEPAKPAVYRCEPLLSAEEEDSLTEA